MCDCVMCVCVHDVYADAVNCEGMRVCFTDTKCLVFVMCVMLSY